ncbi:HAD-IA family hydrolase [Cedecea colo]|nr:HAD-IA family hydrolase [Cedecea colo]
MDYVYQSQENKLSFDGSLDRRYVHRQAINEVFITDSQQVDSNHFIFSAMLPKSHMYFNDLPELTDGHRCYDAMLLLEVFRQISIYVTHKYYDVPLSAKFIFNNAEFKILNYPLLEVMQKPLQPVIKVTITNRKYRKKILAGYTLEMTLLINNAACAQKKMGIGWMDDTVWKKIRAKNESQPSLNYNDIKPADCASVGRIFPRNVVIGDARAKDNIFSATLIVDQSYSSIFDHPLDHIPGMFIIEACRQTALLAVRACKALPANQLLLYNCNMSFQQFCELSSPAKCIVSLREITLTGTLIHVPISVLQNDIINTVGTITLKVVNATERGHKEKTDFYWFDFGGVLSPPISSLFDLYYEKTGIPVSQLQAAMKSVADDMNLPMLAPIENAILTEQEWGSRLRETMARLFPETDTRRAQLEHFGQQWFAHVTANAAMVKQITDMRDAGYRVGILTNNVIEWRSYWQSMVGLNDVVEHIVDSCEARCRKPDPSFFALAEQVAGVTPEQCVLIDDLAENCLAAEKRGWRAIQFLNNDDCLNKLHALTYGEE